jgi:hypothetical protein
MEENATGHVCGKSNQPDWKIGKVDDKNVSRHFGFYSSQPFFYCFCSFFFKNMQKIYHFEIPDEFESS